LEKAVRHDALAPDPGRVTEIPEFFGIGPGKSRTCGIDLLKAVIRGKRKVLVETAVNPAERQAVVRLRG
jgi:hypothetical protein